MYWYAGTTMNAVFDYDYYASQEGVTLSPNKLKILISNMGSGAGQASTPMFAQMHENVLIATATTLSVQGLSRPIVGAINMVLPGLGSTVIPPFTAYIQFNLPDIVYAYGNNDHTGPDPMTSDKLKATLYHELAHASHYEGLPYGNKAPYWFDNVARTIDNWANNDYVPYGSVGTTGAEQCALIELWGDHFGNYVADQKYGIYNHVSQNFPVGTKQEKQRIIYRTLEKVNPTIRSVSKYPWIPDGLFWDLYDDRSHNGLPLDIVDPFTEYVDGVTNAAMFSAITSGSPTTMGAVKTNLQNAYPAKSTAINNLFGLYNY